MPSSPKRSLAKAITYRSVSTVIKFFAFFLITGSWELGGVLTAAEAAIATILYYAHERLWSRFFSSWGKVKR